MTELQHFAFVELPIRAIAMPFDATKLRDPRITAGHTTDWDAYGPRGEQKHCHRYYVGDTAYTSCN
jgi:hypothetical protein